MDVTKVIQNNWPVFEGMGWKSVLKTIQYYTAHPDHLEMELPAIKNYEEKTHARRGTPAPPNHSPDGSFKAIERMQVLHLAGYSVEEIQNMVSCPDKDDKWSLDSIERQVSKIPNTTLDRWKQALSDGKGFRKIPNAAGGG